MKVKRHIQLTGTILHNSIKYQRQLVAIGSDGVEYGWWKCDTTNQTNPWSNGSAITLYCNPIEEELESIFFKEIRKQKLERILTN
jgi:hypothetical protein